MIAIVAISKNSYAQYSQDAIRFSQTLNGSTARIKAIGGAGTAIGGDLSSVSGNPAGLGFFTKSEISLTPEYDMQKTKATYLGSTMADKKNTGNLNNVAAVFYSRLNNSNADKTKGWLSVNFGLGYARTNDFYENVSYGANNNASSISDYYANRANNSADDLLGDWAYRQKLIDLYSVGANSSEYRSNVIAGGNNNVMQNGTITRTGSQSEFNLALGANYSNKLYIGGAIGIASIRYNSTTSFIENGDVSLLENGNDVNHNFTSVFTQDQYTKGTGVNLKLGMIYKPVEAVRLGFNFTSPTWYNMQDSYAERLDTRIIGSNTFQDGENYPLEYDFRTPLKVAGGLAVFIKQFGFISGDVEYVDYSSAKLMSNDSYNSTDDNNNIKSLYKGTVNAHVGAEARLSSFAYLRGGYGVQGNPNRGDFGSSIKTASGGIGFRSGPYSVDATYAHITGSQTIYPYEIGDASPASFLKKTNDNLYLTLSYRF
ncbi:outer membrane protein transport protein [Mucilaginibacter gynuensis]|uniref:Outer membrane protein transport protein n=2 Tax=Mucilaginibacter gynuensis TaxID=1302236 RepID=A0ABP8FRW8_9SPHI